MSLSQIAGQQRCVIEHVTPAVENGLYPAKRIVGEDVTVQADIFCDGHDMPSARLLYKHAKAKKWQSVLMAPLGNDRWQANFKVEEQGTYLFTIEAVVDHLKTWVHDFKRRNDGKTDLYPELLIGMERLTHVHKWATKEDKQDITYYIALFEDKEKLPEAIQAALSDDFAALVARNPYTEHITRYDKELAIYVDRARAGFSAWYELFPRSTATEAGAHGTFNDVIRLLPRIAAMGFDVLYMPPIHPIGMQFRKGKNNSTIAQPNEPGCPWAIGSTDGGHKAILAELGTINDFKRLVSEAKNYGIEIAMDYALQCSQDHPYVKEHPQWFKWRPDGTAQYAENPPKKYQDVLPINFETNDWEALWNELKSVFEYWIDCGVQIFRVDNPHTKSFIFWEWVIAEVKKKDPDVLFLSEAFTRPRVMQQLAKVGFSQSYSYYVWRTTKRDIIEYMDELAHSPMRDYYRANFWPNTPDINPYELQSGHAPLFQSRYFLAATLCSNYGIYGPVFEYMVHEALPGKEEYMDSEKYEIRLWDWEKRTKLSELITIVNRLRRENIALQDTFNIEFCDINNDNLLAYYKHQGDNHILCIVNLDPYQKQQGMVRVPLHMLNKKEGDNIIAHDLLTDASYIWKSEWNYIELDPLRLPMHLFRLE